MNRLQGIAFKKLKKSLTLKDRIFQSSGRVMEKYESENGKIYCHWCNDKEIEKLKKEKDKNENDLLS